MVRSSRTLDRKLCVPAFRTGLRSEPGFESRREMLIDPPRSRLNTDIEHPV